MVTSDLTAEVEIWPFRACAVHPAIIIVTVKSLWTWLWGRYHVPQNVFYFCFDDARVVIKNLRQLIRVWSHIGVVSVVVTV